MKVLVSAASKHGATAEIAAAIAGHLRAAGHEVTLVEPNDAEHLEQYDAFVLGSGVYAGHWLAQGRDLVHGVGRHAHGRPVWLQWDSSGALLVSDDTAGVIWRVLRPGAAPSLAPRPVVTDSMPPQTELKGDPSAQFEMTIDKDYVELPD